MKNLTHSINNYNSLSFILQNMKIFVNLYLNCFKYGNIMCEDISINEKK